ncbi:membrane protein [Thalassobaculum fulvum]|uniref:Membrane protein n=1 Tax=Thalassobaculum fulvum TaxID=1633335 RepID=A0A918XTU6_9PROT|nr:EamA family transporter [Thalassobaculum fulvum]GHD55725.1 membrane protein [Thalassobaculum fulvum]
MTAGSTPRPLPIPAPLAGALMMALAAASFSIMHAVIRNLSVTGEMHPFEVALFRVVFGFLALAPVFLRQGIAPLKTRNIKLFALRGVLNSAAMLMFFYSLSITPLATVAALGFTAPLFATLLAMLVLGEVVRLRRWTAILVGFAGTLIILRPGVIEVGLGPLLVIGSSVVWSVALMVIKVLTRTESSVTITAYASIFLTPVCLAAALPYWTWPGLEQLGWLAVIGVLGTVAQTAMNQSFKYADASAVLPMDFSKLIWAAAIGFALFGEIPDLWTWVGGALIFASATYIGIRESRMRKRAAVDLTRASEDKPVPS